MCNQFLRNRCDSGDYHLVVLMSTDSKVMVQVLKEKNCKQLDRGAVSNIKLRSVGRVHPTIKSPREERENAV